MAERVPLVLFFTINNADLRGIAAVLYKFKAYYGNKNEQLMVCREIIDSQPCS